MRSNWKSILVAVMTAAITFGGAVAAIATEANASDAAERYISDAVIYEPDELPECDRRELDHVVIEKVIGVCLDSEGNGQILNTRNTEFNYIYYGNDDIQHGDVVMTLLTYNPDTNYDDDIVSREDFVIDAGVEVGEEE